MPKRLKRRRKKSLIHKLPRNISGKRKKLRILPFMALVVIAASTCTFFYITNRDDPAKLENERQKMVMDEYQYMSTQERPTVDPSEDSSLKIKIPIITYHYVEIVQDPRDTIRKTLNILPGVFEDQLKKIQEDGYTTYFMNEVASAIDGYGQLSDKSIALTFDDGYEDFYTYAFPLLKKYQMKGTIYIINNLVGQKGYMTVSELKEIEASGIVEIGAHTMDHTYLKGAPEKVQKREILNSKAGLEKILGVEVNSFAYPYGAFDDTSIKIAKEAGFTSAVSTLPGNVHSEGDKYYLYRIRAGGFQGPNMFNNIERAFEE